MEDIGRRDRPPFIHNNIRYAVTGGKVDVVAVRLGVAAGPEIDTRQAHAVPPVPTHLPGLHPAPVLRGSRFGEQPYQLVAYQVGILVGHHGQTPRETPRTLRAGDERLLGTDLQTPVTIGAVLGRHSRETRLEGPLSVAVKKHAGVIAHVGLGQQHLEIPAERGQHRQVGHPLRIVRFGECHPRIRLLIHRAETADGGDPRLGTRLQADAAALVPDLDLARQRGNETVGRAIVEQTELQGIIAREFEQQPVVAVADLGPLRGVRPRKQFIYGGAFHAAQPGVLAQRAVGQREGRLPIGDERPSARLQRTADPLADMYGQMQRAVGRSQFKLPGMHRTAEGQRTGQHPNKSLHLRNIVFRLYEKGAAADAAAPVSRQATRSRSNSADRPCLRSPA